MLRTTRSSRLHVSPLWKSSIRQVVRPIFSWPTRTEPSPVSFPVTEKCPSPTCTCATTPTGLDIDHAKPLNGTMVSYAQHVVISTGKADWTSRIENDGFETPGGDFGRSLKSLLGRHGKYSNPYNNILITNSSFPPPVSRYQEATKPFDSNPDTTVEPQDVQALLFPSFTSLTIPYHHQPQPPPPPPPRPTATTTTSAPSTPPPSISEEIVQTFLLPPALHPLQADHSALLTRRPPSPTAAQRYTASAITYPTILICSHASRDSRCGVLGPLLRDEFVTQLRNQGFSPTTTITTGNTPLTSSDSAAEAEPETGQRGNVVAVGTISHIGGHRWAGNVIVYVPPGWRGAGRTSTGEDMQSQSQSQMQPQTQEKSELGGCGLWYGRVEPRHVEGIVAETLGAPGRVIGELFRGGVGRRGEVLRL